MPPDADSSARRRARRPRRRRLPALVVIVVAGLLAIAAAFALAGALDDDRPHGPYLIGAVDVYPKLSEPGGWAGPRAQDWARLGRVVDQFRIMTYNYSGSWSGPGALSPPDWMDRVLAFAETQVPPRRIVMGLGFYGRAWQGPRTTDLVWTGVETIRAELHPRETRTASRELFLRYRQDGKAREAYFPDALAIRAKLHMLLSRHPHIRGVYAWQMGQEDPRAWRELQTALH